MRIRLLVTLLVLAVFAAACGDDGGATDSAAEATTTVAPGEGGATTAPGSVPGTTPSSSPTDGGGGTDQTPPPTTGTPSDTPETTVPPSSVPAPGAVGQYAAFYLRPSESSQILVDVHHQSGAEPRSSTLGHLSDVLGQVSGKPVTVHVGTIGGGGKQWTADEIRALADSVAVPQSRDQSVLELLYLRGSFAESDKVVGVSVRSDVAAVFTDKVDEAAGVLGNPSAVEDAVSIHEMGHILGLVDLVLNTGRQDPDHPGHSQNRNSVMYYAVESTLLGTILEGGPPRDFDQDDLRDLATIRNGA